MDEARKLARAKELAALIIQNGIVGHQDRRVSPPLAPEESRQSPEWFLYGSKKLPPRFTLACRPTDLPQTTDVL